MGGSVDDQLVHVHSTSRARQSPATAVIGYENVSFPLTAAMSELSGCVMSFFGLTVSGFR